jgi:hypothetical protein
MTNETTQWHGSKAQSERVAMLRALHLMPRPLPPLPFNDVDRVNVRELINDYSESGRSVWRAKYPDEEYRR